MSSQHISFVKVLIFFSVTPLYSSGDHSNMAVVGFSFQKIDARSSPIFEISAAGPESAWNALPELGWRLGNTNVGNAERALYTRRKGLQNKIEERAEESETGLNNAVILPILLYHVNSSYKVVEPTTPPPPVIACDIFRVWPRPFCLRPLKVPWCIAPKR